MSVAAATCISRQCLEAFLLAVTLSAAGVASGAFVINTLLLMQATPFLEHIIQGVKIGGIKSEVFYFQAVATAYILRLNSRTLQVMPIEQG
jgi:hypothetical protein